MCLSVAFLCGTLVVTVPTNAGLVAAADSRMSNSEKTQHCDEEYKIIEFTSTTPLGRAPSPDTMPANTVGTDQTTKENIDSAFVTKTKGSLSRNHAMYTAPFLWFATIQGVECDKCLPYLPPERGLITT